MKPETRYATSGGIHIAYQASGGGSRDLVYLPGIWSHIEHIWREPLFARFLTRLSSFSRLIMLDTRGGTDVDPGAALEARRRPVDLVLRLRRTTGLDSRKSPTS